MGEARGSRRPVKREGGDEGDSPPPSEMEGPWGVGDAPPSTEVGAPPGAKGGREEGGKGGRGSMTIGGPGFRFEFDELDEDEARKFVDDEDDVAVAADGEHQLLEVVVEHAGLRSRRREGPRVRSTADASGRAGGARARARRRGGGGEVLGSIGGCVGGMADLVDADVRAAVEELGGLCGGKASDVGGGADAVEPESSIGGDRGSR